MLCNIVFEKITMKRTIVVLVLFAITATAGAQVISPVFWAYSSKKIDARTYEVHLTANIQPGWHLYSQNQPADAINVPTSISFNKNPLVKLDGVTREIGKMEIYKDKKLGISANQYRDKVEFVQMVKLKAGVKTNINGSLVYQTCDEKKCLPPKKENFKLALN